MKQEDIDKIFDFDKAIDSLIGFVKKLKEHHGEVRSVSSHQDEKKLNICAHCGVNVTNPSFSCCPEYEKDHPEIFNDSSDRNQGEAKEVCRNVIHHTCKHFGIDGCDDCTIRNYEARQSD